MRSYLEHPLLKPGTVEKRLFQLDLASSALKDSTLVVVPTGLGKTVIALIVILARIERGKILFLAPTRPLVEQHASFLRRVLMDESLVTFMTGEVGPEKRVEAWNRSRIVVSTPQVIENDLLSRRIGLEDVSCIIFDEAHRAVGNYAYVYIAGRYHHESRDPLVMGITASPGSQSDKIEEICSNLGVAGIQTRTEDDPDVAPFVYQKEIEWIRVSVPEELQKLRSILEEVLKERLGSLNMLGIGEMMPGLSGAKIDPRASKRELLDLQARLRSQAARLPNPALFKGISIMAEVLKIYHAVELAETQGADALMRYLERLESEAVSKSGSKASRRLMDDSRISQARSMLAGLDVEHPKIAAVKRLLGEQLEEKPDSRIMVFTNYRDTASALLKSLKDDEIVRAVRFVGQSSRQSDEGLSQKRQAEILEKFRAGVYNVLIATSVGEEGIDIPATDMVLFYEPVPSEIRSIQRKGRTGRARAGRVVVLIARGTRDEAYYWISERKEKNMQKQIRGFGAGTRFEPMEPAMPAQKTGTAYPGSALPSHEAALSSPEMQLSEMQLSEMQSPEMQSPEMQSPEMQSPEMQSPEMQSPGMQSPGMQSPGMQSPGMQSPEMQSSETALSSLRAAPSSHGASPPSSEAALASSKATHEPGPGAWQARITDIEGSGSGGSDAGRKDIKRADIKRSHAGPGDGGSVAVFVDPRERDMGKRLEALGMEITLRNLEVGDYVISDRIAIERKTAEDFVNSIIDPGRNLFRQVEDLARSYDRPLLILEGRDLYSRQISPNSIRGAMAAICVDYCVPIIPTEDADETAAVISLLARREHAIGREPKVHGHKTARTLKEQQEYVVSAMPSVGPAVARNLLRHFGSVQAVLSASEEELLKVDLVGPKIAMRIRELAGGGYKG